MKNRTLIITISIICSFAFLSSSQAFDLGKAVGNISGKSATADLKKANLGGIEEKIMKELNGKIDEAVSKVEGEVGKYKEKIDKETKKITDIIDEAEGYIEQARNLKAKASKYLAMVKIVIGVLSCGILAALFMVWRIWRNVNGMRKAIVAAVNYDEVQKRISALEKQVATLKASNKI